MRSAALVLLASFFGCTSPPSLPPFAPSLPTIPAPPQDGLAPSTAVPRAAPPSHDARLALAEPERDTSEESDEEPSAELTQDAPYENGGIDDEPEAPREEVSRAAEPTASDPRLALSAAELSRRAKHNPDSLGTLSLGLPSAGALLNGVQLKSGPHWSVVDASATWGTQETVDYLTQAIEKVYQRFPDAPPLSVGHLSARRGGPLSPHRSHQSGRDVDVGYYYLGEGAWYQRATVANLDAPRTWEFVRALITDTDVEYIFINLSVQKLLKEHARRIGEDSAWLDSVFQYGSRNPAAIIRHVRGHDTHLHVRFYNPVAEELGRRALPHLAERRLVERREQEGLVPYRIHKGETLAVLAKRFNTTVAAIQKANRLRGLRVVAGRTYLVPQRVVVQRSRVLTAPPRIVVPPRRLPPQSSAAATRTATPR